MHRYFASCDSYNAHLQILAFLQNMKVIEECMFLFMLLMFCIACAIGVYRLAKWKPDTHCCNNR